MIAGGLLNPSAVEFGAGKGWSSSSLYVVSWDRTVRELRPPAA